MSTDDECILSGLCRNIRTLTSTNRSILLPVSKSDGQWKFGETSITEGLYDVLASAVVGDYHAAVISYRGAASYGGRARLVLHDGIGTG